MEEKSKVKNFDELNLEELKEANSQLKELNKRLENMESYQKAIDSNVQNIKSEVIMQFRFLLTAAILIIILTFFIINA